jgi:hypothetical protein
LALAAPSFASALLARMASASARTVSHSRRSGAIITGSTSVSMSSRPV